MLLNAYGPLGKQKGNNAAYKMPKLSSGASAWEMELLFKKSLMSRVPHNQSKEFLLGAINIFPIMANLNMISI